HATAPALRHRPARHTPTPAARRPRRPRAAARRAARRRRARGCVRRMAVAGCGLRGCCCAPFPAPFACAAIVTPSPPRRAYPVRPTPDATAMHLPDTDFDPDDNYASGFEPKLEVDEEAGTEALVWQLLLLINPGDE